MDRKFTITKELADKLQKLSYGLEMDDYEVLNMLARHRVFTIHVDVGSGTCGARGPYVPASGTTLICELMTGHAGYHEQGNARWTRSPKITDRQIAEMKASLLEAQRLLGE